MVSRIGDGGVEKERSGRGHSVRYLRTLGHQGHAWGQERGQKAGRLVGVGAKEKEVQRNC